MTDSNELTQLKQEVERLRGLLAERQRQLYYSRKMASLGMLVAGIAHEIRTPIAAINSTQDTLARALDKLKGSLEQVCGESKVVNATLTAIENASKVIASGSSRTLEIVARIRKFARMDETTLRECDLHAEIDDTLLILHHELKNRIEVRREYGALPPVVCNTGQINQVLLNVLVNAAQAIEDRGTITLRTAAGEDEVRIEIEDTGSGISPEALARVFEPGFTTKKEGVGTGLGLAICREIVERHDGKLELASQPGKGTTVTITLSTRLSPSE
jgi:two-component system NtrC family sensor kinase